MSVYTITYFTKTSFNNDGSLPPNWGGGETVTSNGEGQAWNQSWVSQSFTLTYDSNALGSITINDGDAGAAGDSFDDKSGEVNNQIVSASSDETLVGESLEDEYEITVSDSSGATYRMVAISNGTNIIGYTFDGAWPSSGTQLTVVAGQTSATTDNQSMIPCFVRGTLIATPAGEVAIETLREGDLVLTKDHGPQPLRWIGSKVISAATLQARENLRPIRISAGALGENHPAQDLIVSPQHRVLIRSKIAENLYDEAEVLVAAKQLLQVEGIDISADEQDVEYFHMLFDRHEVVIANGAETESMFTGPEALKALPQEAVTEIFAIFPELKDRDYAPTPARILLSGRQARRLVVRHVQKHRALVAA